MRHLTRRLLTLAALLGAACAEQGPPDPVAPAPPEEPAPISPAQARQERLARSIALTLNQPQVRQAFLSAMDASPHPERKVHFQWLLAANAGWLRGIIARESRVSEGTLDRDAAEASALEVYFPVPEHRARWRGEGDLLVATAILDSDAPVAFDRQGRRLVLDPNRPPSTPVLALVPAEQRFSGPHPTIEIEGDGAVGNATGSGPSAGLYMTYAAFTQTFEGLRDRGQKLVPRWAQIGRGAWVSNSGALGGIEISRPSEPVSVPHWSVLRLGVGGLLTGPSPALTVSKGSCLQPVK